MNNWRKSKHSFSNGNCVEVASDGAAAGVRDSADRGGPVLAFTPAAWGAFPAMVRQT